MRRFVILFAILGLMAGSVATAQAEESGGGERSVERSYTGSFVYFASYCHPSDGMGCVSIPSRETETRLTAKVTDAHGLPVSVRVNANTQNDVLGDEIMFGTFCGETTERISFDPGAELEFYLGVPSADCLPGNATTGTIQVTFLQAETPSPPVSPPGPPPPPPISPPGPPAPTPTVERSVDVELRGHLRSVGEVVSDDASCRSGVPVVVQRRSGSDWVKVGSATTGADGVFALRLKDRPGTYRAIAPELGNSQKTCLAGVSATVRHRH